MYFDGVVAQIQQHLRTVDDPYLRSQWQKAKEDLVAEFRIVKEISQELKLFKDNPGGGASGRDACAAVPAGKLPRLVRRRRICSWHLCTHGTRCRERLGSSACALRSSVPCSRSILRPQTI